MKRIRISFHRFPFSPTGPSGPSLLLLISAFVQRQRRWLAAPWARDGIGEARHADFGITAAQNTGLIYAKASR